MEPGIMLSQIVSGVGARGLLSLLTAFITMLIIVPITIRIFEKIRLLQIVRNDGPQQHLAKNETPTMGGIAIVIAVVLSIALWADVTNTLFLLAAFIFISFALIGLVDDLQKQYRKHSNGMSAKVKFLLQLFFAAVFGVLLRHYVPEFDTTLYFPFFDSIDIMMGSWIVLWSLFVIVGSSNAVNLTDGLDGLAIFPVVLIMIGLGVIAYLGGSPFLSNYFNLQYSPESQELVIVCCVLIGAGLGFLWFNGHPAQLFMGDIGSLSLGAILGAIAVLIKQEILLLVMGLVFVAETVSVIIQVASFKLRKKRVFKMAPLHHHFELLGYSESKITIRFWIITLLLTIVGLAIALGGKG